MLRTTVVSLTLALLVAACRMDTEEPADRAPTSADAPPAGQVRIGDIDWYEDYAAALAYAKQADKPLWVHFGENPG